MALNSAHQLLLIVRVAHAHRPSQHGRLWHLASLSIRRCRISTGCLSSATSHEDRLLAGLLGNCAAHHWVTVHTAEAMSASEAAQLHRSTMTLENWRGPRSKHRMLRWHVVVAAWARSQREAALGMVLLRHISTTKVLLIIDQVHVHIVPGAWSPYQAVLIWHAVRSTARSRELRANLVVELLHSVAEGPSWCPHLLLLKLLKQERRMAARCLGCWSNKDITISCLWLIQVRLALQVTAWLLLVDNLLYWHLFATGYRCI